MTGVSRWTGYEAGLLRQAMRCPGKSFANLVGVHWRQIQRWDSRDSTIELGLDNQAALNTILAKSDPAVQERVATMLTEQAASSPRTATTPAATVQRSRT